MKRYIYTALLFLSICGLKAQNPIPRLNSYHRENVPSLVDSFIKSQILKENKYFSSYKEKLPFYNYKLVWFAEINNDSCIFWWHNKLPIRHAIRPKVFRFSEINTMFFLPYMYLTDDEIYKSFIEMWDKSPAHKKIMREAQLRTIKSYVVNSKWVEEKGFIIVTTVTYFYE